MTLSYTRGSMNILQCHLPLASQCCLSSQGTWIDGSQRRENFRSKAVLSAAETTAHMNYTQRTILSLCTLDLMEKGQRRSSAGKGPWCSSPTWVQSPAPMHKVVCSGVHHCCREKGHRDNMTNQRLTGQLGWSTQCIRNNKRDAASPTRHCNSHKDQSEASIHSDIFPAYILMK